ncbi:MAG TPA: hypothetical protein VH370_00555 [Humisphaera sp.]|nr:hypothetical protein [Humisphaera sp.]
MTDSSLTLSEQTPFPPRFRALKRATIALLVLTLALGSLWLWWSHVASTRLQARIAEIKAHGEPLYPGDFDSPPIPAELNAATYLRRAIDCLNADAKPPSQTDILSKGYPPFEPQWMRLAQDAVAGNTSALALARQARAFDQVDWELPAIKAIYQIGPPRQRARQLASLLGDAAMYAHVQGDDAESLERMQDLLHESRAVGFVNHPTVIDEMVGIGIGAPGYK